MKTKIMDTKHNPRNRLLIGTPTLGLVRFEWSAARWGQVIPCNWSVGFLPVSVPAKTYVESCGVVNCLVADAQNVICKEVVDKNYDWLFLHEDDVMLPSDCYLWLNEYIRSAKYPVVSGLYYCKGTPSEPVLYRGRGNSYYGKWKLGQKVWVDGVPTGCLLIHGDIIRKMWKDSPQYTITFPGLTRKVRRVFESPRKVWHDPESGYQNSNIGTSDLNWCDKVIMGGYLRYYPSVSEKKYPFLVDTKMFCKHIDLNSGIAYPGKIK